MKLSGTIVFASGISGDFDIWSLNLDKHELTQLTKGSYWNDCPTWSPDGNTIAYVSNQSGVPELWLMNADGSNQRQLTTAGKYHNEPCWSPDGKQIACVSNYEDGENLDIYIVNADGSGEPKRVTKHPGIEGGPDWSPCGGFMLLSSCKDGSEDIWEIDLQNGNERKVTGHPARDYSPAYSPDGAQIAFVTEADENSTNDESDDADIWVMSRDGMQERKVTANSGSDRYVAWHPGGDMIVCCAGQGKTLVSDAPRGTDRLNIIELNSDSVVDFSYNRNDLEKDIGAELREHWIMGLLPEFVQRQVYPKSFFGSERYPDWKV